MNEYPVEVAYALEAGRNVDWRFSFAIDILKSTRK